MQTATTFLVAAAVAAENVVSAVTVDLAKIAETVVLVTATTVVLVIVMIADLAKTVAHVSLAKIVHLVLTVLSKFHSRQNLIAKSARSSVTLVPTPVVETTVVATAVIVAVDNHCQRLRSFT
jgi:hypothetical protein